MPMPMRSVLPALLVGSLLVWTGSAQAQQPKGTKAPPPAATHTAPPPLPPQQQQGEAAPAENGSHPGWAVRCSSANRAAPHECAIEQTAVLKTGQLVALFNIRVPADTRAPIALVQLPFGLNLPAGAKLQVDEGKVIDLPFQTCENRGCYASTPVSTELLTALRSGKQLKISFQNLGKETMTIPLPLGDFASAYDKIK